MISLECSVPGQNLDTCDAPYLVAHQHFVVLIAIQRPCDQLDDAVEPRQELSIGDALDGNVHDQNPPVEVLAHICLDRRHDVRNTKALEIPGCMGSKAMSIW